jgi:archaellum component FlaF (FlaF/FlaG flagellin family)
MPIVDFRILENTEDTLKLWKRNLEYLFGNNLDDDNITSTTLTLGSAQVKASNIDFGVGTNQVDASDIPIIDASSYFTGGTVELALTQLGSTILNLPAENVKIADASSYFTSTSVEGTLQELGSTILSIYNALTTHVSSTSIHFNSTSITTLVPINSSNIVYDGTTSFATLSTVLTGTTELTNAVALNNDLIATNNIVNQIKDRLTQVGILTT